MIYTLYSFKGGVGRSMALANLGECFFKKGLRVVMIDWDLEAPGLESYFYSPAEGQQDKLSRVAARPGVINMLLEYKERFPKLAQQAAAAATGAEHTPETEQYGQTSADYNWILDNGLPGIDRYFHQIESSNSAGLWLLTAGARSPETFAKYAEAVQNFDWLDFLHVYDGQRYLEWLRRKLLEFADVVLIDSRTGVPEMGGVCTCQIADAVISFCAPNSENVDGVAKVVNSFNTETAKTARYGRDLQVVVIPTRLDDSEPALLNQFSRDFASRLEIEGLIPEPLRGLERPLWNLQIPYIPMYNYGEQRVIRSDVSCRGSQYPLRTDPQTEKLVRAYENIAVHLAVLAPSGGRIREVFQSEITVMFPHLQPLRAPRMAPALPGNWVERSETARALKQALLQCAAAPIGGQMAIWGQAGMGKTSLLARVCQDLEIQAAFPDGIIWLTLEGAWGPDRVQDFLRTSFALPRRGGTEGLRQALSERKFLFIVDDVWATDQLEPVFAFGKRNTRVILTRDLATASQFADTVLTIGKFTAEESGALLKLPTQITEKIRADATLNWLFDWPLGASLLRDALERNSAQNDTPELAWNSMHALLQRSGIALLDQPEIAGRNGSLALSLRETVARLQPGDRRLLISVARAGAKGLPCEPGSGQRLAELGLARAEGESLRADETIYRWLVAQGELTEDTETRRHRERKETLESGYAILRGRAASLGDLEKIAYRARDLRAFSLARKLLALARQHPDVGALPPARKLKLLQQHALCTYKDEDMVADERLSEAFQILNSGDLLDETPSQETLGLAGTIYKLRWRYTGQRRDLEQSLSYYQRGAEFDLSGDFGYTRINAAFVLDLIAAQETQDSKASEERRQQATRLREEIVAKLPALAAKQANASIKNQWWYGGTMAEALFGLGRYSEARYWLREALALDPPLWQLETSTRQMAFLAHAQGVDTGEDSEAWRTLAMLAGDAPEALRAITVGKVGLALSGGGFRASLFHIGVLARLAELDILRHVEVLSCVSGGSIIGAHYYLEVRRLLQDKRDREITREDYIEIVKRIERDFLTGVQKNLRNRLFAGWLANVRSIFVSGYNRTKYLGELLEQHIYASVPGVGGTETYLNKLQIAPRDGGREFNPKLDNWRRSAKAPILLLNATTLNTGHVWQFAVNWMGEPPISASSSVDSNDLLRRMYYSEAPVRHRNVRLGHAVAASACVPGLFDPIELDELFPRRRVRLVDGGVHDNQGIAGLREQECSVILVSDASGQMTSQRIPSGEVIQVFKRTQDISMARIRQAEFQELATLQRSSALGGLMFLHLKKDLDVQHVDWLDCQDPYDSSANPGKTRRGTILTTYGVPKSVQSRIAGLRTDLDTFSDAEAYALMLSGYRMASADFAASLPQFPVKETSRESWGFLAIEPTLDRATDFELENDRLQDVLTTGSRLSFKVWRLRPIASAGVLSATVILLFLGAMALWWVWGRVEPWFEALPAQSGTVAIGVISLCCLYLLIQWWRGRKSLTVIATGLLMVTVGWILARHYLWFFDRLYRRAGTVRRCRP